MRSKGNDQVRETARNRSYRYTVYFEPQADGGFAVVFPAFPEIVTFGRTLDEARAMPRSADIRYAVVIEKADGNYSAYVPDLPGCAATGATIEEVECEIKQAIRFHLDGLRNDGVPVPRPTVVCEYLDV